MELETKLAGMERKRQEEEDQRAALRSRLEEELRSAQEARSGAEREVMQLQARVSQQAHQEETGREASRQAADLKKRLSECEVELQALMHEQTQLLQANSQLCSILLILVPFLNDL